MGPQKRRPSHASSRWTVSLSLPSAAMLPMPYALSPSATSVSRAHTCAAFVRRSRHTRAQMTTTFRP